MPLIMLTGGPLSGKTFITQQLVAQCKKLYPDREVQVLSHETMNLPRRVFTNMDVEKKFNQKLISCVEQALTPRRVLIVDYNCLTKSLRYQFHGKANFAGTTSCCVQVVTPYEESLERLKKIQEEKEAGSFKGDVYSFEIFEDLWNRYEEPQDTCRWDAPLHPLDLTTFQTPANGAESNYYEEYCTAVLNSVCDNSKKALSRSNLPTRNESGAIVTLLDKIPTLVIQEIIKQQQAAGFVVGALLERNSFDVHLDAAHYFLTQNAMSPLPSELLSPLPDDVTSIFPPEEPQTPVELGTPLPTEQPQQQPAAATSGLKMVRKTIGKKTPAGKTPTTPSTASTTTTPKNTINNKYILTLHAPLSPSQLFELKNAFTKIATMMNLKTDEAISRGFIEYLMPLL